MAENKIRRALIAVYDKTGIADFARALVNEFGIEIISTGGTARHLKDAGISVTLVEEVTGFPEMLDGRVKTLHPKIHAAILADRDNPEHMRQLAEQGIKPIDMVVVNLYPFEKTVADLNCKFEDAIEMIDIGGPCLLRAAAKNHRHVWIRTDPQQYSHDLDILSEWQNEETRNSALRRGASVFELTCKYDAAVANWLSNGFFRSIHLQKMGDLRYGENPHQNAQLLLPPEDLRTTSLISVKLTEEGRFAADKAFSFNNYLDATAALELTEELTKAFMTGDHRFCCVFVKHTNPCGVGISKTITEAYRRAYLGDPNAAMGGILATNVEVTVELAENVMNTFSNWGKTAGASSFFLEVWVAPFFHPSAIEVIRTQKKWGSTVRLSSVGDMGRARSAREQEIRCIAGGLLQQNCDLVGLNEDQWKVVTKRKPSESEMADLRLAWLVAKHTKSNAISICKDGMLIGNGAGQMSRVMSCRIATWLAKENGHADQLKGSVAASDAFFPFRDGPEILLDAGVTAIIQPGGSKRDDETIAACDAREAAMIFTGMRHFKH